MVSSWVVVATFIALLMPCEGATLKSRQAVRSPVQKVIELLEENKVKVTNDLAAEEKEMAEYTDFCESEASEKGYAIKTADEKIGDLSATIEECQLKIPGLEKDVASQASLVASKQKELSEAKAIRDKERTDFDETEKAMVTAIDQLERAVTIIKRATKGASFLQVADDKAMKEIKVALKIVGKIVDAGRVQLGNAQSLQSLLQTGSFGADSDDEYERFGQPQAKEVTYESKSGGIVEKIEEMKEKAEEELTAARAAETKASQDFAMLELSITNGIKVATDKISTGKSTIGAKTEEMSKAKGELTATNEAKAADEEYLATLKHECEESAAAWEERQESAKGEIGAINKAIAILSEGVRVFLQVSSKTQLRRLSDLDEDSQESSDDSSMPVSQSPVRSKLVEKLKDLSHRFGSYALMEMAGSAAMDPFAKIKGLIEEMIEKLVQEANEEATQKAFCDEEMGKSKKAQSDKTMRSEKIQSRLDTASSRKAELENTVKTLEAEVADLDKAAAEATKIRNEENANYLKASKDFSDAAKAVEQAIKVLKDFYDGQAFFFLQTSARRSQSESEVDDTDDDAAPELGGAKSDAASVIIGILEMSGEDFTKLHMETETEESTAQEAYDKLMTENKVSKAAKMAEIKGSLSEIKSLSVTVKDSEDDFDMTSKELDAVVAYMDELKPQCETKVMSYAEKKARREAEIDGLKEALAILSGETI